MMYSLPLVPAATAATLSVRTWVLLAGVQSVSPPLVHQKDTKSSVPDPAQEMLGMLSTSPGRYRPPCQTRCAPVRRLITTSTSFHPRCCSPCTVVLLTESARSAPSGERAMFGDSIALLSGASTKPPLIAVIGVSVPRAVMLNE